MNGLLVDENLPKNLNFTFTGEIFFASDVGKSAKDSELWTFAKTKALAIITKDSDFSKRVLLSSPPPWVVRFCVGNLRLKEFEALLEKVWPAIVSLLPEHKLVQVFVDRIEAVK